LAPTEGLESFAARRAELFNFRKIRWGARDAYPLRRARILDENAQRNLVRGNCEGHPRLHRGGEPPTAPSRPSLSSFDKICLPGSPIQFERNLLHNRRVQSRPKKMCSNFHDKLDRRSPQKYLSPGDLRKSSTFAMAPPPAAMLLFIAGFQFIAGFPTSPRAIWPPAAVLQSCSPRNVGFGSRRLRSGLVGMVEESKGEIGGEGFTAGHAGLRSQGSLAMNSNPAGIFMRLCRWSISDLVSLSTSLSAPPVQI
jgi:hypothetical protein